MRGRTRRLKPLLTGDCQDPLPRLRRYSPQHSLRSRGEKQEGRSVSSTLSEANLGRLDRPKAETEGARR